MVYVVAFSWLKVSILTRPGYSFSETRQKIFPSMEITKTSVLRFGTLLLQAAALLRLLCLLISFLWSKGKWSIPSAFGSCSKYCRQIQSWLKRQQGHGDSSSEQELGVMRCKWMWMDVALFVYWLCSLHVPVDFSTGYAT